MTNASPSAVPELDTQEGTIEATARALASAHQDLERAPRMHIRSLGFRSAARQLERALGHFRKVSNQSTKQTKAAEWFLDNYYLIRRVARQVEEEMPRDFARRLPRLVSGSAKSQSRVGTIARALVVSCGMALDLALVRRFIDAYQEVSPCTIAELWALPTMLRAMVLEQLVCFLALEVPVQGDEQKVFPLWTVGPDKSSAVHTVQPADGVELAIRALRVLDVIDWQEFFEKTNRVEAILQTDPVQVYARMDFQTCDSYRKVIESIAWDTARDEEEVTKLAIQLAIDSGSKEQAGHVGYYLVSAGRRTLEARLNYHASGMERLRRGVRRWPTVSYLLPIWLVTFGSVVALGWYLIDRFRLDQAGTLAVVVAAAAAVAPLSAAVMAASQYCFARLLPPVALPKLDFKEGLPHAARTLVVIPTLLGRAEDVALMSRQLELHYLANPDPQLQFALLTDGLDTKTETDPTDEDGLVENAARAIEALNKKHAPNRLGPFHLLHRRPRWNPAEERFMGWERKRGKLEELNRLLRGDTRTSYTRHVGDPMGLLEVRFVITLDSDTQLPAGSAQRMVGLLAHPLNQAVFDAASGRVLSGYTIVQPSIQTCPSSFRGTLFSRLFGGDVGLDIYTHASSELYQDLFGAGVYVGKGAYDVDTFMRSVDRHTPENALLSHDLLEGIQGRTALASDIVLFDDYPDSYATYARRMHRWVRGDWQLLPWLFARVPSGGGDHVRNRLSWIDRWKIVDNLRRSLSAPPVIALLLLGWLCLPGDPRLWTIGTLLLFLAPSVPSLASASRTPAASLGRSMLALVFLVSESAVVGDAVARVLVRKLVTGKHLLQWTSAAQASAAVAGQSQRSVYWSSMMASPLLAVACGLLLSWYRPSALVAAAPLLVVWFVAPEIACWISRPFRTRIEQITASERKKLRMLARRTWRFFDMFVGPDDQWLPVDNHQEKPREQTAHRTSPTNIGLLLVSTLSAYDFGYIGPSELSLRLRRTLDSIARMPHYQGHLFNWYDTRSLIPLLPRYVSAVDSGNFAGCLIALKHGCKGILASSVVRLEAWDGLCDSIDLLEEVVKSAPIETAASLVAALVDVRRDAVRARDFPGEAYAVLRKLGEETSVALDRELLVFLEDGARRNEPELLRLLRASIDGLHQQLKKMRQEFDTLLPWLGLKDEAAAHAIQLPTDLRLDRIAEVARGLRAELEARRAERRRRGAADPEHDLAAERLDAAFRSAEVGATDLVAEFLALAKRADEEVRGMDFKLLFDRERKLLHIGYDASSDRVDPHHYDLLASEARLASYIAIIKRDIPERHWYALGRPIKSVEGSPVLLSWGGTMFEYLMPSLLMRSQAGTLLARTNAAVVAAQMAYAKRLDEPWGISESAYARVDADQTFQYRSHGVAGLGFKRGLEQDRVVTPYASLLALSIRPRAVVANIAALEAHGMLGTYGLFEALDFTPERVLTLAPPGQKFAVVPSYMAHHQGMLLVALGNFLNRESMVERFHADSRVASYDELLNESSPGAAPAEWPDAEPSVRGEHAARELPSAPSAWSSSGAAGRQAWLLGNGRLSSLVTASGGGGLYFDGLAVTRYEADPSRDEDGQWFFLRDEETGEVWRTCSSESVASYSMHKAELHLRARGISVRVDVSVAATDDVELRQITLHNETEQPRFITVTSAGRPVLLDAAKAATHPAFSSMFVESERLPELEGLVFSRRPQALEEDSAVLVHRLVREGHAVTFGGYESDRGAFFGRAGSALAPAALCQGVGGLRGRVGPVLDPIMSLMAHVELKPKASVTLAFVNALGRTRTTALELARKYGSLHAVEWSFRDSDQESPRRLARLKINSSLIPSVQRLFSALHYAAPALRAADQVRAATPPCQRRLWGRGISGDNPIVVLRVERPDSQLLPEALAAQRYLRSCGVAVDLVLIDEHASGYLSEATGTMRGVLSKNDANEWLDRHGGIFVVAEDQTPASDVLHLEACARVLLNTRGGSLADHLDRLVVSLPKLPRFEATVNDDAADRPRPRPKLKLDNGTGGFSDDGREYVIELPAGKVTPAPWCNVIANAELGCLVSESSLGTTWSLNSGENRLTPWRNDSVFDIPSEALYLRDEESAEVWTTTALPSGHRGNTLIRHGAGYTTYERESHGLVQELTVFVPPDSAIKIVRLRVKNTLGRHRRLTATYYAEWVLGARREQQRPHIVCEFEREHGCLMATCDWNVEFSGRVAFLAAKADVHGFTADRGEFLGPDGDYAQPEALRRWGLSGRVDTGADPCAAMQLHLELAPNEEQETHFLLGQAASRAEVLSLVTRFRDAAAIETAWQAVSAFWDGLLDNIRVKTPEPAMDVMLNRWLLYQTLAARFFGRTAFYQSSGAFGYRDQLQDVLALLHTAPQLARAHILEAARHQFEEGDVLHWWHPPSGRGVRTRCSDDMAWLPYVVGEYVDATGDMTILDEQLFFLCGKPLGPQEHDRYDHYESSAGRASLFEHCRRALERATTAGSHGLPLMGDGDWNDGMSRVGAEGRGESVWLAWFLCATMERFAGLSSRRNDDAAAAKWSARAEALRTLTEEVAWDGDWFLRAFHDDGSLVGSAKSRECRIDCIAQSWAVLCRDKLQQGYDQRIRDAVSAADQQLVREAERLVLLFWPPYDTTVHDPGYVRGYPPGVRENGGQYTHAATWLGFAHAQLGDGAGAERIFRLLNPALRSTTPKDAELYRVEPYVLAGDVYSCPPWVGRGGWTWYTGSSAWTWRLGIEQILGLRKRDGHLLVDPCIPPSWPGFEAWVRVGQRRVHISVVNPEHVASGVVHVTLDGNVLAAGIIPLDATAPGEHEVRICLGHARPALAGLERRVAQS